MPHPRIAALLQALADHQLLDADRLEELARSPAARGDDLKALARAVLDKGWLTRHQINLAAQGRGKELRIGPYLVLDKLGEGGMGHVYKARHQTMQRVAALKVIRKERLGSQHSVDRFYQEIQAAAQLHHPNVVVAYDAQQAGDVFYFAMEYVDGVDLARLVREGGVLPVAEACEYARQAALGLQHAHERGLVHRDVKPHNLMVSRPSAPGGDANAAPVVKVLDLGLARLNGAGDARAKGLTQTGQVMGTPDFLAPEQAVDPKGADTRADVYSLGCTLYFLLAGRAPFRADTLAGVLLQHQMEGPPPLRQRRPDVPPGVEAVVRKMMAKKPADRYQTPAEAAAALEPFCRGDGVTAASGVVALLSDVEADDPWDSLSGEPTQVPGDPARRGRAASRTAPADLDEAPRQRLRPKEADRTKLYLLAGAAGGMLVAGVAALAIALALRGRPADPDGGGGEKGTPRAEAPAPAPAPPAPRPVVDVAPVPVVPGGPPPRPPGSGDAPSPPPNQPAPAPRPPAEPPPPAAPPPPESGGSPLVRLDPGQIAAGDRFPLDGLMAVLKGHTDEVWSIAFALDGKTLATGGKDGTVRLWDLTGAAPRELTATPALGGPVRPVLFAPDGKTVAARLTTRPGFRLLDVAMNLRQRSEFAGATALAYAADGATAAEGLPDGSIRLWDVGGPTPAIRATSAGHTRSADHLAFSRDGRTLASAGADHTVRLWDGTGVAREARAVLQLPARGRALDLALSPDGKKVAVGHTDGSVYWWDLDGPQPRELPPLKGHVNYANAVAFSPDGKLLLSTGGGLSSGVPRFALLRDAAGGGTVKQWRLPERSIGAAFSPDGRYVALGCHNRNVYVLRLPAPGTRPAPPPEASEDADADRGTAAWALRRGCHVQVSAGAGTPYKFLTKPGDLPDGSFKLVSLTATPEAARSGFADTDLKRLRGLSALSNLNFMGVPVTDAGLAHLEGLPALAHVSVSNAPGVTDAGVAHLARLPALRGVQLTGTKVTGAGLARLKGLPLNSLNVSDSAFADADLHQLPDFPNLMILTLHNTRVTDAGLKELKRFPSLQIVQLGACPVRGAGLASLAELPRLSTLNLDNTTVGDAGLRKLAAPNLTFLSFAGTRVTDAGLHELARFPKLQHLSLGRTAVTDRGMVTVAKLEGLTALYLDGTAVGDAGLDRLKGLSKLTFINVQRTAATGAGISRLQAAVPQLKVFR